MVHEARGEKKIAIIRQHPRYDPAFADVFVKLVDKLDPRLLRDYPPTITSIGEGGTTPTIIIPTRIDCTSSLIRRRNCPI
jgi:hypothetical protein